MSYNSKERAVYAVLQFLDSEANSCANEDTKESIEVAKQCLETAYKLEYGTRADLDLPTDLNLEQLIGSLPPKRQQKDIPPEMKAEAEQNKNHGNNFMKEERYNEAVSAYTKAVLIDPDNSIYYSNRAAAYNKLERFLEAITDCDEAISINPNYSKAYGRKGLALSGLNRHGEAIDCYKRALELDPTNENIKTNLKLAEEKASLGGSSESGGGGPGLGGLGGMFSGGLPDINTVLTNPTTVSMISQMMQNPAMMQMANNFMQNFQQQPPTSGDTSEGQQAPGGVNMSEFLRMGQQFAQQMQQTNPETVENLRNQMGGMNNQPPPNPDGNSS